MIVITVHFTKGTLRNVSVVKDLERCLEVLSLRTQRLMAEDLSRLEQRELFVPEGDRIIKSFSSSPFHLFSPFNLEFYFLLIL